MIYDDSYELILCLFLVCHCCHSGVYAGLWLNLLFQCEVESESSARAVGDGYVASMELDGMLYYGKAEPGTAFLAGASFVNTVKPLEKVWQLLSSHSFAVILETDTAHCLVVFKQRYIYVLAFGVGYGMRSRMY